MPCKRKKECFRYWRNATIQTKQMWQGFEETKLFDGVINLLLELEDFELDGLLSKDALIPMTDVGILLMEFTSQDQLMATIKCDVLADEGE